MKQIANKDCSLITTNLPIGILSGVGRVIVSYASIEHEIKNLLFTILNITLEEGRLFVSSPNTEKTLRNINKLLKLKNIKYSTNISELIISVKDLAEIRNWLAHGVWTEIENKQYLQIISGESPQPGSKNKISKILTPTIHQISQEQLALIADAGEDILGIVLNLHSEMLAQIKP